MQGRMDAHGETPTAKTVPFPSRIEYIYAVSLLFSKSVDCNAKTELPCPRIVYPARLPRVVCQYDGCVLAMLFLPCFVGSNLGNPLTRFPQGGLVAS